MKTIGRISLMLAVVTVLMWSASGAHGQTISFGAAPTFPAGISPTSVATGVLTGSGKPDVAVTNQHGVLILLNDGSGGLVPGNSYVVGTNPQSVVIDDFDGNGKNDLAVVNQGSGTVSILLGNGDGTFAPGAAYAAGNNPRLVLTGDLNNDGKRDLVVVDSGTGPGTSGVSILLGNGDGSFQSARFVALGSVTISATIGDFDGDGKADIAAVNQGSDSISILLGKGDGTFQAPASISLDQPGISVTPTSIVAGDFDKNGKLDLAVATPNVHEVAVLLGNGNGTFASPVTYTLDDPNFVNNINKLASVDLNGDGYPDLVLDNLSSNHVTVLLNKGDGTFPSASSYAAGPEPIGIAIADFNGDGFPDVIVADNAVDGEVALLVGNGNGTLQAAPLRRSGFVPTSFATGDFNGDGKLDLVTVSSVTPPPAGIGTGTVMLGNADGTFQAPKIWSTSAISSVAVGDFNGDGKLDLVETNLSPGNGNLSLLLGNGDGTFQSATSYTVGTTPVAVAVADLNGDGKPDVIVANRNSGNISVLLNAGNGSLVPAVDYATPATGTPESIAIGDFNGDGLPDIAVAISGINASSIAIFINNGNGAFQPYISIPSGFSSSSILHIVAADFDGDGKVDLAVTDGATLSVLIASGNAAFNPFTYLVGAGAAINGTLVVADLNGDQKPDLVTSSRDGLAVLINTGDGGFQAPIPYAPFLGGAIAVGDFYGIDTFVVGNVGDGRPDIVAADSAQDSTTTDTIAVIPNQSTGPQVTVTIQTSPTGLPLSVYYQFANGNALFTGCTAPCTFNSFFGLWSQIYAGLTLPGSPGVQYALDHFSDNGFNTLESSGANLIHDVQVLAVPTTVTVYYKPQYQVTIVASPSQGGVVSPASGNFYDLLATVPFLAVANPGYTFVEWDGEVNTSTGPVSIGSGSASTPFPVYGPTTMTANFALITPTPGSKLGASQTFTWSVGTGVTQYALWLGTSSGASDLYNSGYTTATSATVSGLPTNGSTIYAYLFFYIGGSWHYTTYTYIAAGAPAVPSALTSPAPGSQLATTTTFTWSTGTGVTQYAFWLGTTQGASDLYNSGHVTTTSATVSGLPINGSTIYAQLFSYVGGVWKYTIYTFIAAGPPALISPTPGSILGSSATFAWSAEGTGVTLFDLLVGTTGPGSSNLYNSGHTTATSANVTGLPTNGSTVYAEFFYFTGGVWKYTNYTYIASGPPAMISPKPGTVLGTSANFFWSPGIGATMSELTLGTTGPGSSNLFSSGATTANKATVTGIPSTGATVYAQLGSYIGGAWQYLNYTYTETAPPLKSALITPTPGSVLGASANFTWTTGSQVTLYDLWVGTTGPGTSNLYNSGHTSATSAIVTNLPSGNVKIYAQLYSYINGVWQYTQYTFTSQGPPGIISPTPGSVLGTSATFVWSPGIGATMSELMLGTTGQGSSNLYSSGQTTATTGTVTAIPAIGATVYAQLGSYIGGAWQYVNYTYTETAPPAKSALINPTAGSVLGASTTFTWSAGSQVTQYDLQVGTTGPGSYNLYNSGHTTARSSGAVNVPQNGETVYVELFSYLNGAWLYTNYTFKAQ